MTGEFCHSWGWFGEARRKTGTFELEKEGIQKNHRLCWSGAGEDSRRNCTCWWAGEARHKMDTYWFAGWAGN
jgi:hypothetical protein